MKPILALLLIGAAYATASPMCSKTVFEQCNTLDDPRTAIELFRQTVDFLNLICEEMTCVMDYERVCGSTGDYRTDAALRNSEKVYKAVCEKGAPMRLKYLENAKCMDQQSKIMFDKCKFKNNLMPNDPKFCPSVAESFKCNRDEYLFGCGQDAADIYDVLGPGPAYYGCQE